MNTLRESPASRLVLAALCTLLLVALAACDEDPVSPHRHGWSGDGQTSDVLEREFSVAAGATIRVNDFVGEVEYRTGAAGVVRVVATMHAPIGVSTDVLLLTTHVDGSGVEVIAENPDEIRNASVDLSITAPADAIPDVAVGVGGIDYRGRPAGPCRFSIGVGEILLALPVNADAALSLEVGVGSIRLGRALDDVTFAGPNRLSGRLGRGVGGSIRASVGVGDIRLAAGY